MNGSIALFRFAIQRLAVLVVCLVLFSSLAFARPEEHAPRATGSAPANSTPPSPAKPSTQPPAADSSKKQSSLVAESVARRDALLVVAYSALAVLLVLWPIVRFLLTQWCFRKERIFGALSGDAVVYYYKQFRPGAPILTNTPAVKLEPAVHDLAFPRETASAYFKAFKVDFYRWYGRRYYFAPVVVLAILTAVASCWAQRMLRIWAGNGVGPDRTLRALVAAALAGAFVWVISDELDRLRRRDFTTSDVYYYIFRILLAVPFAWSIAAISIDGQPLGLPGAIPLAFFLGSFPTNTLFTIARRLGSQQLKLGDDQGTGNLELEKLQSVGKTNAERFKDEGVSTIAGLAYADPVDLTIRTNFDFNYVVDCVSQSLMWIYFEDDCEKLAELSIRGAQEIIGLLRWADDASNLDRQKRAQKTIEDGATKLSLSPEAFRTSLEQIRNDPYAQFLVDVWC